MSTCSDVVKAYTFGPTMIFSDSTAGTIHVVSAVMSTARVRQARISLQALAVSTNSSVQVGYQLSNDQSTWYDDAATPTQDAVTLLGQARTAVGTEYGSLFTTIPQNSGAAKLWIRFVVLCKNSTEAALVNASVGGRIETRALA